VQPLNPAAKPKLPKELAFATHDRKQKCHASQKLNQQPQIPADSWTGIKEHQTKYTNRSTEPLPITWGLMKARVTR
jgi:hypothetical protein